MRTALWKIELLGLSLTTAAGIGVLLTGCDQGCDVDATCVYGTSSGGTVDDACPADPADGPVGPECGIWVSASSGDDSSPGTQQQPVQTLTQAIALAQTGSKRVYACGEKYQEAVILSSGVSLFGGFDCAHAWKYVGTSARATILGTAGQIPLVFSGGDEPSLAGNVEVHAADAVKPGGSSIAVLVQDYAQGALRRADLFAGNGADGGDGVDGGHEGTVKDGLPGKDGVDACTVNPGSGGASVKLNCGDGTFSLGGPGGDGGDLVASSGGEGLPLPDPNPDELGIGGKGEASSPVCTPGHGGIQGITGTDGVPVEQEDRKSVV